MQIEISEVQILPIKPRDGLVGFASLVINNAIYLGLIGIHTSLYGSGYRLTYPTKQSGNRDFNLFHPINPYCSKLIEQAVIAKFKEVMNKTHDRYSGFDVAERAI